MKCVILAAGRGERMMPLTANKPKPLLKVNGKPILEHIFDALPEEIDEVIIVVKYLGDQIKKHFGKEWKGKKIKYVTGSSRGDVFSFLNTEKHFKDKRFMLIYGDEMPNKIDVRRCLKEKLSVLTYDFGTLDGTMVLNRDIYSYKPKTNSFRNILLEFIGDHKITFIESEYFIGEINTPEKLKEASYG